MMYYVMIFFSKVLCILPPFFCRWIGDLVGEITWLVVPTRRKRMATANIVKCLGLNETAAESMAKTSWTRFGYMIIEVLRFPAMKKHMDAYVTVVGRENMEKALALGRGGVVATAHSGNWELLGGTLAQQGFPLVGVAQKQKNGAMDRFINEYRTLIGMHVTYKSGVREMFKMLGEGWVIALLMDQDAGDGGILLQFLGRETSCVPGPASLARFKDAPILPVFISQNEDGITHTLTIHEPVFVAKTQDKHDDIRRTTEQLTQIIEQHIRQNPAEWFWLHDRWKSVDRRNNA